MAQYVILQSGYLSFPLPDLVRSYPTQDKTALQLMNLAKADRRTNNPFHFHREVESIFKGYEDSTQLLRDFEFRQRILTAAKRVFGDRSFYQWCALQQHSPYLTTMHRRFIYDTLNYLYTGQREVSIESWMNLVEARDITDIDARMPYQPDGYFDLKHQESLVASSSRPRILPPDLLPILQRWATHVDGYKDMLYTLYIVFGKQVEYTPV